jgi:hypothetical protein
MAVLGFPAFIAFLTDSQLALSAQAEMRQNRKLRQKTDDRFIADLLGEWDSDIVVFKPRFSLSGSNGKKPFA